MVNVQDWLNAEYISNSKKDTTKEINSKKEQLEGVIEIKDFPELEIINLWKSGEITKVTIANCPKVKYIDVSFNKIEEIEGYAELSDLEKLNIAQNEIKKDLDLSKNKKLKVIICYNNPLPSKSISVSDGLSFFNGATLLNPVSISTKGGDYKDKLSEIAENLGIKKDDLKDKTIQEIEKIIDDKVKEKVDIVKELENSGITSVDDVKETLKKLEVAEKILGPDFIAQIEVPTST